MERIKGVMKFSREDKIWFTADSHIGHRNIIKYCQRPFSNVEEMNETLICNWNKVVGKNDYVFHLGDFSVGGAAEWTSILDNLNGRIFLVLGNHDMNNVDQGFMRRFEDVAMQMLITIGKQRVYLNHYPFLCYGGAYRGTWQLFGHVHTSSCMSGLDGPRLQMLFPRQYDVGVDNNNYTPISFEEVEVKIQKQITQSLSHDAGSLR